MALRLQRFVLDTSAFTGISEDKEHISKHIEDTINLLSEAKVANISCYMPPSIWDELSGMLERKGISHALIEKLDTWTVQKAPSRMEMKVPAEFIYDYIGEVRERFNKALREAEAAIVKTHHAPETHGRVIAELRDKYRSAVRQGILDSKEDLDVLLLAKELKAGIVARDEGIMKWAKQWGIRFVDGHVFPRLLKEYIGTAKRGKGGKRK
jgi:hypothetical protein